jgi:hypothetical protein
VYSYSNVITSIVLAPEKMNRNIQDLSYMATEAALLLKVLIAVRFLLNCVVGYVFPEDGDIRFLL